jgi:DNA-directed RNA polymerase subunit M/transcription elongation factor TFIIS
VADSRRSTFQFSCPECFVGLKASVAKVGSRLACPSCQAYIVVPEAPKDPSPTGADRKQEGYDVRPDDGSADEQTYVTVLCPLCHTRMYAPETAIGRKLTCPDCGTKATVARIVEFESQEEEMEPVEFDGATEYGVRPDDYRPPADYREANRQQIPVVCPRCQTRMHAEEDQVGSLIVCPDCQTETLVPEAPEREPELEQPDVGEYAVGKPSEVYYPKFAQILDNPVDEPDTPADDERRSPRTPKKAKTSQSRPTGSPRNTKPTHGRHDAAETDSSEEKIRRRSGKAPAFGRMFTFLADSETRILWLVLAITAAIMIFLASWSIEATFQQKQGPMASFAVIRAVLVCCVCGVSAVIWLGAASIVGMTILQETAAGIDEIEEWPNIMGVMRAEGVAIGFALGVSGSVGFLLGKIPQVAGWPDWMGAPIGVFFLLPIVLLSLLERGSLINLFSVTIWQGLLTKPSVWIVFYIQSAVLVLALVIVDFPSASLLGIWSAILIGPWFTAIWMVYFRLMGRLAWHVSGRRVPEEPIEPPDLSRLIERGEAEEIC